MFSSYCYCYNSFTFLYFIYLGYLTLYFVVEINITSSPPHSDMLLSMAIGFLFLGGGRFTFGTSNEVCIQALENKTK